MFLPHFITFSSSPYSQESSLDCFANSFQPHSCLSLSLPLHLPPLHWGGFHFMREGPLHSCLPVPTMMPSLQKELSKFFLNEWHTIYLLKVNIFTNATL